MKNMITLAGLVGTDPRHIVTSTGLPITSFRLATIKRRFDSQQNRWVDDDPNWYTITCFRRLALNVHDSVRRSEHVIVYGELKVREWEDEERSGVNLELEAETIGHDLNFGFALFESL